MSQLSYSVQTENVFSLLSGGQVQAVPKRTPAKKLATPNVVNTSAAGLTKSAKKRLKNKQKKLQNPNGHADVSGAGGESHDDSGDEIKSAVPTQPEFKQVESG